MPRMGSLEAEVMAVLWAAAEPLTVRQVRERMGTTRGLAYTTVMTVLSNLYRKCLVDRDTAERAYVYLPRMTREQVVASALRDVLDAADDPRSVLLHFVESASVEESRTLRDALQRRIEPT